MPCVGPTPGECAEMEKQQNAIRYGEHASNLDMATRVACALWAGMKTLKTRHELEEAFEPWVLKWGREHDAFDKSRRQRDKEKEEAVALANRALAKLTDTEKKALGLM